MKNTRTITFSNKQNFTENRFLNTNTYHCFQISNNESLSYTEECISCNECSVQILYLGHLFQLKTFTIRHKHNVLWLYIGFYFNGVLICVNFYLFFFEIQMVLHSYILHFILPDK